MTIDPLTFAIASLAVMGMATAANVVILVRGFLREEITSQDVKVVLVLSAVLLICAYGGLLPWAINNWAV